MKTLKEALEFLGDGFDIGDNTYDYGNYFGYDLKLEDYYDRVLDFMATHIEIIKYQRDWYSTCDITKFIETYQNQLDEFMEQVYLEEYTPKYICEKNNIEKITSDDELFYEIYFELLINDILNGGLSEKQYEKLYNILISEGK